MVVSLFAKMITHAAVSDHFGCRGSLGVGARDGNGGLAAEGEGC